MRSELSNSRAENAARPSDNASVAASHSRRRRIIPSYTRSAQLPLTRLSCSTRDATLI
jgi:hypothetical protein